jgi:hypothetical protein
MGGSRKGRVGRHRRRRSGEGFNEGSIVKVDFGAKPIPTVALSLISEHDRELGE